MSGHKWWHRPWYAVQDLLLTWQRPSGHYKKRVYPEVAVTGEGTEEKPWGLKVLHSTATNGQDLRFRVFDWIDDHTGHKMCNSRLYMRLLDQVTDYRDRYGEIPLTEEQVRAIDPDHPHLPENRIDDE